MKSTWLAAAAGLALAGAMMFPANTLARAGAAPGLPAAQAMKKGGKEQHPKILAAIQNLQRAKAALQAASKDFGGHREEALKHTEAAIDECHKALQADKD